MATALCPANVKSVLNVTPTELNHTTRDKTIFTMGKCVVKECNSRSQTHNKSSGITFHTVPRDAARREKWVEKIRLLRKETDWLPSKSSVICSKHFRDQDKLGPNSDCGRVSLSSEAIPMLDDESRTGNPMELLVRENMDVDAVETDEEIEEIIESPQQHKMRKTIHRLKIVSTRRHLKIKNLLQKNKRLRIKNKKLKDVIEDLKKKRTLNEEEVMKLNLNEKQ